MTNPSATEARAPGWDSKVRARVVRRYGSIRNACTFAGVSLDGIGTGRDEVMRAWSRLVERYGSTAEVEARLLP